MSALADADFSYVHTMLQTYICIYICKYIYVYDLVHATKCFFSGSTDILAYNK
jgi:hypothetical protein